MIAWMTSEPWIRSRLNRLELDSSTPESHFWDGFDQDASPVLKSATDENENALAWFGLSLGAPERRRLDEMGFLVGVEVENESQGPTISAAGVSRWM